MTQDLDILSKMEIFAEKVNVFQPLIIFVKSFILDVRLFWIRLWKR